MPKTHILHSPNDMSFLCPLDRQPFAPCGSPKVYRHLARGRHVFRVKSIDGAGHESAVRKVEFSAGQTVAPVTVPDRRR